MDSMQGDSSGLVPLSPAGVDFSNETQAVDFIAEILDDSILQVVGNQYAVYFWYCVVVVIALATTVNIYQTVILKIRVREAARNRTSPATPKTRLTKAFAALIAVSREISYPQLTPVRARFWLKVPPFGTILLLLVYIGVVLVLEFSNNDIPGAQHYTALGIRASWLAVAQIPLLVLLAGKNNLIGLLTGVTYERLNVLHRWVSRMILLLTTLHFGYQSYGWNEYGVMQLEWQTDTCPPTGIAAYAVLLWINLSTFAPIRDWSYEFFVVQHLLSFFAFIVAVMYHIPSTALYARVYIWIPIGLYVFDRLVRSAYFVHNNIRPAKATIMAASDHVTKIQIKHSKIKDWSSGSFVLLSVPRFGLAQSHPATIASSPDSHNGDLVFLLKGCKGFTKRILNHASSLKLLPSTEQDVQPGQHTCFIDGPYGGGQADFAAFDTVILIAGSMGATFTISILLDLAGRAKVQRLPVRAVVFLWMVKSRSWIGLLSDEFKAASAALKAAGIEVFIDIRVTCVDEFAGEEESDEKPGCQCSTSGGACCCGTGEDDSNTEKLQMPDSIQFQASAKKDDETIVRSVSTSTSLNSSSQTPFSCTPGRPSIYDFLSRHLEAAQGETGISVCGPLGLSMQVRNTVAFLSDERAVHKGTEAQGIYLHVEGFSL